MGCNIGPVRDPSCNEGRCWVPCSRCAVNHRVCSAVLWAAWLPQCRALVRRRRSPARTMGSERGGVVSGRGGRARALESGWLRAGGKHTTLMPREFGSILHLFRLCSVLFRFGSVLVPSWFRLCSVFVPPCSVCVPYCFRLGSASAPSCARLGSALGRSRVHSVLMRRRSLPRFGSIRCGGEDDRWEKACVKVWCASWFEAPAKCPVLIFRGPVHALGLRPWALLGGPCCVCSAEQAPGPSAQGSSFARHTACTDPPSAGSGGLKQHIALRQRRPIR